MIELIVVLRRREVGAKQRGWVGIPAYAGVSDGRCQIFVVALTRVSAFIWAASRIEAVRVCTIASTDGGAYY